MKAFSVLSLLSIGLLTLPTTVHAGCGLRGGDCPAAQLSSYSNILTSPVAKGVRDAADRAAASPLLEASSSSTTAERSSTQEQIAGETHLQLDATAALHYKEAVAQVQQDSMDVTEEHKSTYKTLNTIAELEQVEEVASTFVIQQEETVTQR